ncbi:MAG TPA: TetR/AcrR family transcriptional regulator [Kiritimatiellia bacterium]|nr:TetR/AcrR family transcriptional regulator [Kiritimatiellia bacterium]HMO99220.1 TetR/AcrR family transcriptional regulator [Kiritimatiellia bacterium]HMP96011.1 TetR/AcrR family transcriptional regulator [Kiritimatiellia bacterium]
MSNKKVKPGRENQKWRTRKEILLAAQRLLSSGRSPGLEEVAEEARVSRATIYRYFTNVNQLLLEAPLDALTADEAHILKGAGKDPVERAACVQAYFHDLVAGREGYFRNFLRAALEQGLSTGKDRPVSPRQARRVAAYEEALEPLKDRLAPAPRKRLVHALSALTSIEAFVVFRDVCGLTPKEAGKTGAWAVRQLLAAALADAKKPSSAMG